MVLKSERAPGFPDDQTWKELVKDLKLAKIQQNDLDVTLRYALLDLEKYFDQRRVRGERKSQVERLNRFYRALTALVEDLEDDPERLAQALPFDAQEAIGLWLADQAVRTANADPSLGGQPVHVRKSLGLKRPTELLTAALTEIKAPIDDWMGQYQPDRGGREPDVVRDFLIIRLADSADGIIGASATPTSGGAFNDLCTRVLNACDVKTTGLEDAIYRALQKRAANRASRQIGGSQ